MSGISDGLCRFVADYPADDLPASTQAAAARVLLDATGVMLGASDLAPEAAPFVRLAATQGVGPCAILGTGIATSAPMAAFANGALAHALDFEDAFDRAPGHPNASLVPALLALAQAGPPVDGRRFLAALALGCEVSCRIALALRRPMEAGGWYPPPIVAGLGAAAGAARLLGLDAQGVKDALSLALCQVTMPGEIKHSAGTVIRAVREGFPAQAAVTAALLARDGVRGFEEPLEGRAGFYALYAGGQFAPEVLADGLGQRFLIEELTFKPWPSCRGTHAAIELALALRAAHAIEPGEIERVTVSHDDVQAMLCEPIARKRQPTTAIDAKFSIPFCTALAFSDGMVGLDSFAAGRLHDEAVLALAERIDCKRVVNSDWRNGAGGAVTVQLRDGRSFTAQAANALGCPERPLDDAALLGKFVACAGRAAIPLDPMQAGKLADAIIGVAGCGDVGQLFSAR